MEQILGEKIYSLSEVVEFATSQFHLEECGTKKYHDKIRRAAIELIGKGKLHNKKESDEKSNRFIFSEDEMWIIFKHIEDYLTANSTDHGEAVQLQFGDLKAEIVRRRDAEAAFLDDETKRHENSRLETADSDMILTAAMKWKKEAMFESLFRLFFTEFDWEKLLSDMTENHFRHPFDIDIKSLYLDSRLKQPENNYFHRDDKFEKSIVEAVGNEITDPLTEEIKKAVREEIEMWEHSITELQKEIASIKDKVEKIYDILEKAKRAQSNNAKKTQSKTS